MEGDADHPQGSCVGVEQTQLLCVELPALTGHTVDPHQTIAGIQQPGTSGDIGVKALHVIMKTR